MPFTFITDKGEKKTVGAEKPQGMPSPETYGDPGKAFSRGAVEGGLGAYGNLLSLAPGYKEIQKPQNPVQQAGQTLVDVIFPFARNLPTSEKVSQQLSNVGIEKKEETPQEKGLGNFGRLFGGGTAATGNIVQSLLTAFTGSGARELAKAGGIGEKGQALAEILGSLRFGGAKNNPKQAERIKQPKIVERGVNPKEAGFISPERLNQQLNRVSEEGAELASKIGKENPTFQKISGAIKADHPIQEKFNTMFNGLEEVAKNFNPPIKTDPLNNFLATEAQRYAKTGSPTELGKFVLGEIKGWQTMGESNLYNVFRRYRLNNERIREIRQSVPNYQGMTDTQRQQINFLTRMNDSIKESFRTSLSENLPAIPGQGGNQSSLWLKAFEDSNLAYSNYLSTKTARNIIDPLMSKNVTDQQITKFLGNKRNWEDLDRFLGPEETGKLHTLLEDTQKARNALQGMQQKEVGQELLKHGLLSLIPGVGKYTTLFSIPKIWQWARGRYHSSPGFETDFHKLTEALVSENLPAIRLAIDNMREKEKPKKKVQFITESKKQ